ncbi:MAG: 3-hydroxyacyl-CoA dehydrogenase [Martelella sp.]|uniref:3-hydroxyacyl-CoA dehydrogenase/enoyl-CoA hydratase family protein n=1 Tax=unclassified Martelella TaxID=2629616 RepID=UPI000C688064|nr:3-hydroxyacyl-CoA dehydrogenase/enoyl-CoA hydratase family protein [Martelella sp.]MAU22354.1 3-hydroxyacyl-CoA dehydrogenase [Martelella sp.]
MALDTQDHPVALYAAETGIRRAAVIGAGSMGAGIAAQFANAGIPVELLDIAGEDNRNGPVEAGIARQIKTRGFMGEAGPALVRAGNVEDHLDRLADCDWIIEAIVERLDLKRALYHKIEQVRRPGAIVSSNTSTIPHAELIGGLPASFTRDFVISHFFNPPRVMQLFELVTTPETDPAITARLRAAAQAVLGKTVVDCRDTPGFIANRIGCFWMAAAAIEAVRMGLTVEEADAVHGAFGVPRTGVFGLFDLVGIDLVPQVWASLLAALPPSDRLHRFNLPADDTMTALIAAGRFGRKSGAGFYRKGDAGLEALDLATHEYRALQPMASASLPAGGRDAGAMLSAEGRLGDYARAVFANVLCYAAENGAEIAGDVEAIDAAIALGYGWRQGPFALADRVGASRTAEVVQAVLGEVPTLVERAREEGGFYRDGLALSVAGGRVAAPVVARPGLSDAKSTAPVIATEGASLWDIGDGVGCFEVHTKMNALHPTVFDALEQALEAAPGRFRALVIGNDDPRAFSVGADLTFILGMTRAGDFAALERYIRRGQELYLALKYQNLPVVAAMHGYALGGGCEFALHADAIVAHAELNAGLPEVNVGLIPGWGGCTQLALRNFALGLDADGAARRTFAAIHAARPSSSAEEARAMGILRPGDRHVMARSLLLDAAKARAIALAEAGYAPPKRARVARPGPATGDRLIAGLSGTVSEADIAIARALAAVVCGESADAIDEVAMMAEERAALLALARTETTAARMEHMLKTGKPLKN